MISFIQPLPVGNAMQLVIAPPAGATSWRVLRRLDANFAGPDDPAALMLHDGTDKGVVDAGTLVNGTPYYYHVYYLINGAYQDAFPTVFATPAQSLDVLGPDPLDLVRERLDWGFSALVTAGRLSHPRGQIPVLLAPPTFDTSLMPLVIVHLASDTPAEHALGDQPFPDFLDPADGLWDSYDGWLSSFSLHIEVWSLNSDERLLLRKALKRIVQGNLPVFNDAGMIHVDLQLTDQDDFQSVNVPVYQVIGTFSCLAPSVVVSDTDPIQGIDVSASIGI